jgi:hypothetical protein
VHWGWQRHPDDLSGHALEMLVAPAVCRLAAPLARDFARQMARTGLLIAFCLPTVDSGIQPAPEPAVLALTH